MSTNIFLSRRVEILPEHSRGLFFRCPHRLHLQLPDLVALAVAELAHVSEFASAETGLHWLKRFRFHSEIQQLLQEQRLVFHCDQAKAVFNGEPVSEPLIVQSKLDVGF